MIALPGSLGGEIREAEEVDAVASLTTDSGLNSALRTKRAGAGRLQPTDSSRRPWMWELRLPQGAKRASISLHPGQERHTAAESAAAFPNAAL